MTTNPLTQPQRLKKYRDAKSVIMIDFDGTLCTWSYPEMGEPEPGARHFMKALIRQGFLPIIWSCRFSPEFNTEAEAAKEIERVAQWCVTHNIPYHAIDSGHNGKALCLAYVDDRGIGYRGNFDPVLRQIMRMKEAADAKAASTPT